MIPDWHGGLTYKDWLCDGLPLRGIGGLRLWNNLDWSKAWIDMGPSPAGNLGPYWHVPLRETWIDGKLYDCGDTVHRLYPKVLASKWLGLIRQACKEVREKVDSERLKKENDRLTIELMSANIRIAELERKTVPVDSQST